MATVPPPPGWSGQTVVTRLLLVSAYFGTVLCCEDMTLEGSGMEQDAGGRPVASFALVLAGSVLGMVGGLLAALAIGGLTGLTLSLVQPVSQSARRGLRELTLWLIVGAAGAAASYAAMGWVAARLTTLGNNRQMRAALYFALLAVALGWVLLFFALEVITDHAHLPMYKGMERDTGLTGVGGLVLVVHLAGGLVALTVAAKEVKRRRSLTP